MPPSVHACTNRRPAVPRLRERGTVVSPVLTGDAWTARGGQPRVARRPRRTHVRGQEQPISWHQSPTPSGPLIRMPLKRRSRTAAAMAEFLGGQSIPEGGTRRSVTTSRSCGGHGTGQARVPCVFHSKAREERRQDPPFGARSLASAVLATTQTDDTTQQPPRTLLHIPPGSSSRAGPAQLHSESGSAKSPFFSIITDKSHVLCDAQKSPCVCIEWCRSTGRQIHAIHRSFVRTTSSHRCLRAALYPC